MKPENVNLSLQLARLHENKKQNKIVEGQVLAAFISKFMYINNFLVNFFVFILPVSAKPEVIFMIKSTGCKWAGSIQGTQNIRALRTCNYDSDFQTAVTPKTPIHGSKVK